MPLVPLNAGKGAVIARGLASAFQRAQAHRVAPAPVPYRPPIAYNVGHVAVPPPVIRRTAPPPVFARPPIGRGVRPVAPQSAPSPVQQFLQMVRPVSRQGELPPSFARIVAGNEQQQRLLDERYVNPASEFYGEPLDPLSMAQLRMRRGYDPVEDVRASAGYGGTVRDSVNPASEFYGEPLDPLAMAQIRMRRGYDPVEDVRASAGYGGGPRRSPEEPADAMRAAVVSGAPGENRTGLPPLPIWGEGRVAELVAMGYSHADAVRIMAGRGDISDKMRAAVVSGGPGEHRFTTSDREVPAVADITTTGEFGGLGSLLPAEDLAEHSSIFLPDGSLRTTERGPAKFYGQATTRGRAGAQQARDRAIADAEQTQTLLDESSADILERTRIYEGSLKLEQLDREIARLLQYPGQAGDDIAIRLRDLQDQRAALYDQLRGRDPSSSPVYQVIQDAAGDIWNFDIKQNVFDPGAETIGDVVTDFIRDHPGVGRIIEQGANLLDTPYQLHTRNVGVGLWILANAALTGIPGGGLVEEALDRMGVRDDINNVFDNGYTGPGGTEFGPGGRAVFEMLLGQVADDRPGVLGEILKVAAAVVFDPLIVLPGVANVAKRASTLGRGMRLADDASLLERGVGGAIQATSKATELTARGLDEAFMLPFRGASAAGRRMGFGRPGLFQEAPVVRQAESVRDLQAAKRNAELLGTKDVPMTVGVSDLTQDARQAFDDVTGDLSDAARAADDTLPTGSIEVPTVGRTPGGRVPDDADIPTTAAVADDIPIQRADQETGEALGPLRSTDAVLDDLPIIRSAVVRSEVSSPGASRVLGDPVLIPNTNGYHLEDIVARRGAQAAASGDMAVARQSEAFLREYQAVSQTTIGEESGFLGWREISPGGRSGDVVDVPNRATTAAGVGRKLTDNEVAALGPNAVKAQNSQLKHAYEQLYRMWNESTVGAELYAKHFGGSELPTNANPLFRTADDTSWVDERFLYLAERFIRTGDVEEARRIWQILHTPRDEYIREFAGKPYLTAIPPNVVARPGAENTMQKELYDLLRQTREAYQTARGMNPKPQVAEQLRGGLKADSKKAADAIENAKKAERKLKAKGRRKARKELAQEEAVQADLPETSGIQAEIRTDIPDEFAVRQAADEVEVRLETGKATVFRRGDEANGYQISGSKKRWELHDKDGNLVGGIHGTRTDAITRAQKLLAGDDADFIGRYSGKLHAVDPLTRAGARLSRRIQQYQDATVTTAPDVLFDDIVDPELRYQLEIGTDGFSRKDALLLDTEIEWKPPRKSRPGDPEGQWRVVDAIREIDDIRTIKPDFDYDKAFHVIAYKARGLPIDSLTKPKGGARVIKEVGKGYDGYMNGVQRQHRRYGILRGLRNIVGDTSGQLVQGIVRGRWEVLQALSPFRIAHDIIPYRRMHRNAHQYASSIDDPTLRETGQLIPLHLMPGTSRGEDPFGGLPSLNRRVAEKGWLARATANLWTVPFFKDYLTMIDVETRIVTFTTLNRQFVRGDAQKAFAKRLRQEAGDDLMAQQWANAINAEARRKSGGQWNGMYSPGDVSTALKDLTVKQRHDLSRAWQGQLNEASTRALKETEAVWFTYRNLNIDEHARKAFVFHYWQSRAIPLHARAALQNPVILNGYYKMWQTLEELQEDQNLPPYLDRMFRFYQSPAGIEALFDPIGILLPTTLMDLYDEKGQRAAVFINQMSPMVSAALAVVGMSDFSPDVLATKGAENFVRKFLNYLTGQGVDLSTVPIIGDAFDPMTMQLTIPSEELVNRIIGGANQALQNMGIPLVDDFEPFNRGASELDQLRTWVQREAVDQFGPRYGINGVELWTAEQMGVYEDAMTGTQSGLTGNPLLDAAREHYGNEDGLSAALSLIAPGGAVVNSRFRTDLLRRGQEFRDQGFEGTPEQQAANEFREEARAGDPAWQIAINQYYNIGTDEQKRLWAMVNDLVYNPEEMGEVIIRLSDGQFVEIDQLIGMTESERQEFVKNMLAGTGEWAQVEAYKAERDAFKEANPELTDFTTYQRGVYGYEDKAGGIKKWREVGMADNPNFQRAMDDRRKWLKDQGYSGEMLEAELDDWATGQAAFFAAVGQQESIYDPDPLPVYDPTKDAMANPDMEFMLPQETGSGSGGALSGDSEYPGTLTDAGRKDLTEQFAREMGETLAPAPGSFEEINQKWMEDEYNFAFSNAAAEALYGDQWDDEKVRESGKPFGWVNDDDHPNTNYYPDDATPSEPKRADRFTEWVVIMSQNYPYAGYRVYDENGNFDERSWHAWIDWELGIQEEVRAQLEPLPQQVPAIWLPWVDPEEKIAS